MCACISEKRYDKRLDHWIWYWRLFFSANQPRATRSTRQQEAQPPEADRAIYVPVDPAVVDYNKETLFKNDYGFTILAGDFGPACSKGCVAGKHLYLSTERQGFIHYGRKYRFDDIAEFVVVSDDNRRGMGNVVGWGTLGWAIAGPLAALGTGALANSKKDWVTFAVTFRDGRRVLAEMKHKHLVQFEFTRNDPRNTAESQASHVSVPVPQTGETVSPAA